LRVPFIEVSKKIRGGDCARGGVGDNILRGKGEGSRGHLKVGRDQKRGSNGKAGAVGSTSTSEV